MPVGAGQHAADEVAVDRNDVELGSDCFEAIGEHVGLVVADVGVGVRLTDEDADGDSVLVVELDPLRAGARDPLGDVGADRAAAEDGNALAVKRGGQWGLVVAADDDLRPILRYRAPSKRCLLDLGESCFANAFGLLGVAPGIDHAAERVCECGGDFPHREVLTHAPVGPAAHRSA